MPRQLPSFFLPMLALSTFSASASAIPLIVGHQGFLRDGGGLPLQGTVDLVISLYDQPDGAAGGAAVWSELHEATLADGYYALTLGGPQHSLADVLGREELYLGVAVAGEADIQPLRRVVAVPYAILAANAVGDITPRSIEVGGQTVIDASGAWVGLAMDAAEFLPYTTPQELLAVLLPIDGPGSRIDADLVDGLQADDLLAGAEELLAALRRVDGAGSGFDADTIAGYHGAQILVSALQLRNALRTVGGDGSELDFDLLDGLDSEQLLRADQGDTLNGKLTVQGRVRAAAPQSDGELATKGYVDGQVGPGAPCPAGTAARGFAVNGTALCVKAIPPVVSAIEPASGPALGGTMVTVSGSGLAAGARLFIGASEAGNVVVVNGTTLTAVTGAALQTGSRLAVSVVNEEGLAGVLPAAFSYQGEAPAP